jgi:hypothetical protein
MRPWIEKRAFRKGVWKSRTADCLTRVIRKISVAFPLRDEDIHF